MEEKIFRDRISKYELYKRVHKTRYTLLSNLRLILMIFIIGGSYLLIEIGGQGIYWIGILLLVGVFAQIVQAHRKLKRGLDYADGMIEINQEYVDRIKGEWQVFEETGKQFLEEDHPYAKDLDILGENSLFQMMNIAHTWHGKKALANLLLTLPEEKEEILKRQRAVKELGNQLEFVQKMEYITRKDKVLGKRPEALLEYTQKIERKISFSRYLFYVGPALTCISLLLGFVLKQVTFYTLAGVGASFQLLIGFYFRGIVNNELEGMKALEYKLHAYQEVLQAIQKQNFHSDLLKGFQNKLFKENFCALKGMKELTKISDRAHLSLQPLLAIPLNALFLWDLLAAFKMQQWREQYGQQLEGWLEAIGQIEAFMSLSVLTHFNMQISEPLFTEKPSFISAKELGHPLLKKETRISNTFSMQEELWIITGSNMSGKTTFLRTVGINMILAYCGAPVFAKSLTLGVMKIYSCMRIQDDLKEGKSTFYAELMRIKMILEAAKTKEPMLFLIDEIFRGTNSIDRIEGAKSVLKGLNQPHIMGAITTHDLELCMLEKEKRVVNYHFSEHYKENEILFDYSLKEGPSTSTNAKYLMKMVGIDI